MAPEIAILIPNRQEPNLEATLEGLRKALEDIEYQLMVSHDPESTGVGATLRRGLELVSAPWVILLMADGTEDPIVVRRMIRYIAACEVPVWGNRWWNGKPTTYRWSRYLLNRLGNRLIAWAHGPIRNAGKCRYQDWTDLAKVYRTEDLRKISWSDDFRCAIEIPLRYLRVTTQPPGLMPVLWRDLLSGQHSSFRWRQLWGQLLTVWQLWQEDRKEQQQR